MNFILFLAFVLHVSIFQVNCRSVHLDIDASSRSEVREDKDLNHDSGISGIFSWKRLKPILHRELQRIRNVKGTNANKINQLSTETTVSIQLNNGNSSNAGLNADKNKDIYSKNDTEMTNTSFIIPELANSSSYDEKIDVSDVEDGFGSSMTPDQMPKFDEHATTSNFLDNAVSGILHPTEIADTTFVKSELTKSSSQNEEITNESDVEDEFAFTMTHDQMDPHVATSNFVNAVVSDIPNETETVNISSVKSELTNNSHNEETIDESDVEEAFTSNMTHDQMPSLDQHTITSNFPNTPASDSLYQTGMANISFVKPELINNSSWYEKTTYESDGEGEAYYSDVEKDFVSDTTHAETSYLDHSLTISDLPDNIISGILNQTADSMLLQALKDNGSSIDAYEFDETSVLSQGGHIATLQEVSTMGFELLIDSETKKNLLLMEILTSQSALIDDFTDEDDSDFTTLELDHINESEEDETTSNGVVSFSDVTSLNTGGFDFTTLKLSHINQNEEYKNATDSTIQNTVEIDYHFTALKHKTENEETTSNEKITVLNNNVSQTENPEFITHEVTTNEHEFELSDSVQNDNGTEWTNTEPEHLMCPDPGWCVFWFLGLEDTCAKDSHCHGSLICCKIGCTKTCIDADT